jgi:hypothetical protein
MFCYVYRITSLQDAHTLANGPGVCRTDIGGQATSGFDRI